MKQTQDSPRKATQNSGSFTNYLFSQERIRALQSIQHNLSFAYIKKGKSLSSTKEISLPKLVIKQKVKRALLSNPESQCESLSNESRWKTESLSKSRFSSSFFAPFYNSELSHHFSRPQTYHKNTLSGL